MSVDNFSKRLARALQIVGVSKSNLALMIGVSPATVTGWVTNKHPTIDNLHLISKTLNLSLCWLVNGLGPMYLHGPMHVSRAEEDLILKLRFFTDDVFEQLLLFLATITQSESEIQLINQARASQVLENVEIAMLLLDKDSIIQDINSSYLSILGLADEFKNSVIGTSIVDWVAAEQKAKMICEFQQAIKIGHVENFHVQHIQYASSNFSSIIFSGAYHGNAKKGFMLATAFLMPK